MLRLFYLSALFNAVMCLLVLQVVHSEDVRSNGGVIERHKAFISDKELFALFEKELDQTRQNLQRHRAELLKEMEQLKLDWAEAKKSPRSLGAHRTHLNQFLEQSFSGYSDNSAYWIHGVKGLIAAGAINHLKMQSKRQSEQKIRDRKRLPENQKEWVQAQHRLTWLKNELGLLVDPAPLVRELQPDFVSSHTGGSAHQSVVVENFRSELLQQLQKAQVTAEKLVDLISRSSLSLSELMTAKDPAAASAIRGTVESLRFELQQINEFQAQSGHLLQSLRGGAEGIWKTVKPMEHRFQEVSKQIKDQTELVNRLDEERQSLLYRQGVIRSLGSSLQGGLRFVGVVGFGVLLADSMGALYLAHYLNREPTISPLLHILQSRSRMEIFSALQKIPDDVLILVQGSEAH